MKKKILSLIFAILLIIPCVSLTVLADDYGIVISDDYQSLTYKGSEYVRFDSSLVEAGYDTTYDGATCNIPGVDYIDYTLSVDAVTITASVYFNDGSSLTAPFINKDRYYEYQYLIGDTVSEYTISFWFPDNNNVTVAKDSLLGIKETLNSISLWNCEQFEVVATSEDDSFYAYKGALIIIDDRYYYVDYAENEIKNPAYFYAPDHQGELWAAEITDVATCEQIKAAYASYMGDLSLFVDSDITDGFGTLVLVFLFVIVPFAALVLFLILAFRAKTPIYKKIFRTIYIVSAAELVSVVLLLLLPTLLK